MAQRIDVHQHITDRIIAAIEQGAGAFKLPWHRPAGSIARPTNIESGKGYRGINVVSLWVEAQLKGYAVPVWGTYKQMVAAGYQVRKGEKASLVVFYRELEFAREDAKPEDDDQTRSAWLARGYWVFNAEQRPACRLLRLEPCDRLVEPHGLDIVAPWVRPGITAEGFLLPIRPATPYTGALPPPACRCSH